MDHDNEFDIFTLISVITDVICILLAVFMGGGNIAAMACALFLAAGAAGQFYFSKGFSTMFSHILITAFPFGLMLFLKAFELTPVAFDAGFLIWVTAAAVLIPFVFGVAHSLAKGDSTHNDFAFFFREYVWLLLFVYGLFMIYKVLHMGFSLTGDMKARLVPFATFAGYIEAVITGKIELKIMLLFLLYTAAVFIPWGFITGALFYKAHVAVRLISIFLLPVFVSVLQVILKTSPFDIDDIFFGFAGGFMGLGLCALLNTVFLAMTRKDIRGMGKNGDLI